MDESPSGPVGLGCLTDEHLKLLLDGRLAPEDSEVVDAHLRVCPTCDERLSRLDVGDSSDVSIAPDDPFLGQLKRLNWAALGRDVGRPRKPERNLDLTVAADVRDRQLRGFPQLPGYRVVREVGRGGMGIVYEAVDLALGRRVALKVLADASLSHHTSTERFRREARAAGSLHHTNIVPVFGVGEGGGVIYYVMQFIQGHGLDFLVAELRRLSDESTRTSRPREAVAAPPITQEDPAPAALDGEADPAIREVARALLTGQLARSTQTSIVDPPAAAGAPALEPTEANPDEGAPPDAAPPDIAATRSEVLPEKVQALLKNNRGKHQSYFQVIAEIGSQVALALAHAHDRGIVHRDIKPSNLLLDVSGVVWITDFGLASSGDDGLTATGDILGTVRYMAPERFRGEGGPRADIYALGMTLYELVTFRQAFDHSDRLLLMQQIRDQDPARPRSLNPQIPRDLETMVLKAIEKDPRQRYESAATLGDDLKRFLAGEPIRARQVGPGERAWKWARRRPAVAALIGLVVASMLAGTTVATIFALMAGQRAEDARSAKSQALDSLKLTKAAESLAQVKAREAIDERNKSRRLSASLTVDRGLTMAEAGQPEIGLHWLMAGLHDAPDDGGEFGRMVRRNLAGWLAAINEPLWIRSEGLGSPDGRHVFVSPDGRSFATFSQPTADAASAYSLREMATGRILATYPDTHKPFSFMPDGKSVILGWGGDDRLKSLEIATGRTIWTSESVGPEAFAIGPRLNGEEFLLLTRVKNKIANQIQAWSTSSGRPVSPTRTGEFFESSLGTIFVLNHADDNTSAISVLDIATGNQVEIYRSPIRLEYVGSSDSNELFVSLNFATPDGAGSKKMQFLDLTTRHLIGPVLERSRLTAVLPAGNRALIQEMDSGGAGLAIHLREIASGRRFGSSLRSDGEISSWGLTPEGRHVLLKSSYGTMILWRLVADPAPATPNHAPIAALPNEPESKATRRRAFRPLPRFNCDGTAALRYSSGVGGGAVTQVLASADGLSIGTPARHRYSGLRCMVFSPDGRRFATGSHPGGVAGEARVWDAATGAPVTPPFPHTNYISAVAFSPDGRTLAVGDYHGIVRLWDVATSQPSGRPMVQESIVWSLAFSPDGKTLAVGHHVEGAYRPGVQLWDVATGSKVGALLTTSSSVERLLFRPDGRVLTAEDESSVYLWDMSGPKVTAIGNRLTDELAAAFHPDGRLLVTGSKAGSIQLRAVATGSLVSVLHSGPVPVKCLDYAADGRLIVAGFGDGTIRIIDPATAKPIGPPRTLDLPIADVAFRDEDHRVVAIDESGEGRAWDVPGEVEARDLAELSLRIEATTGYRLNPGPSVVPLGAKEWGERLERLGRKPSPDLAVDPAWHEPPAHEAEARDNAPTALWHLDRLVAARPDDWTLRARRARVHAAAGNFNAADVDVESARRLAPPGAIDNAMRHWAAESSQPGRLNEALWFLDRVAVARPDDWTVFEARSHIHARLGHDAQSAADRSRVLELGGGEPEQVLPAAEQLARAGRWPEAVAMLGHCCRRNPSDPELAQARAIASLFAGDHATYRESRGRIIAQLKQAEPIIPEYLSRALWLTLSDGSDDLSEVLGVLRKFQAFFKNKESPFRSLTSSLLGALEFRSGGNPDAALDLILKGADPAGSDSELRSFIALIYARKGDAARSQAYLEPEPAPPAKETPTFWEDCRAEWLRREATLVRQDASFPAEPFAP